MKTRTSLTLTSLAALWIVTGLFGGLKLMAAPTQPAAQTHSQMVQAHPMMP